MSDTFLAGVCIGGVLVPAVLFVLGALWLASDADDCMERWLDRRDGRVP